MVDSAQLTESKAIHRRTGPTFYLATRLLPRRVRRETYVLYAFFRVADEVVDGDHDLPPDRQRARLEYVRATALGRRETDHPVLSAFAEVREREGIDEAEVNAFVDAMLADVDRTRYGTYADLEGYLRGSAAAVGEMMTTVMGPDRPEVARPHARALGTAFQLTNFLRDVREDVREHGRIYLPLSTLSTYGVDEADVEACRLSPGFRAAIEHELRRTEARYREGVAGIEYLPPGCRFPVLLAAVLYADHHRLVRERDHDVLSATPSLSTARKAKLGCLTWLHWRLTGDPTAVFDRLVAFADASAATDVGATPSPTG